jgi:cation transport ATPase
MAVTMLTPRDFPVASLAPTDGLNRWLRAGVQAVRQNLIPWLAIKSTLTALVVVGLMGFWTAFAADTVISLLIVAHGWRLARR